MSAETYEGQLAVQRDDRGLHYCYELQCWVEHRKVMRCGHGEVMSGCYSCAHWGEAHARCETCPATKTGEPVSTAIKTSETTGSRKVGAQEAAAPSETLLTAVLGRLRARGRDAQLEHDGGISFDSADCLMDALYWFGTVNGTWDADVINRAGDVVATLQTGLLAVNSHAVSIADAMIQAVDAYEVGE